MTSSRRSAPGGRRRWIFFLLTPALSLGFSLIIIELALSLFPVFIAPDVPPINEENPVYRFKPDQTFYWSAGPFFEGATKKTVNNAGFVNDIDYDAAGQSPLVAVIGDSYIEAMMVTHAQTIQGRLAERLAPRARAYSFAMSGAPLSQYLVWSAHARAVYRPDLQIFVVVGNDFDESLSQFAQWPGYRHFHVRPDGTVENVLNPYRPTQIPLLRHSATVFYLLHHLQTPNPIATIRQKLAGLTAEPREAENPIYVGNTAARADAERLRLSRLAVDAFLTRAPDAAGLPPERIIIVVDGFRSSAPDTQQRDEHRSSYFGQMRRYLIEQAETQGFAVIDLEAIFDAASARDGQPFQEPYDGHWNGYGHGVVTDAIVATPAFQRFEIDAR